MKRFQAATLLCIAILCTFAFTGCEKKDPNAEKAVSAGENARPDAATGKPAGNSSAPTAPPATSDAQVK